MFILKYMKKGNPCVVHRWDILLSVFKLIYDFIPTQTKPYIVKVPK